MLSGMQKNNLKMEKCVVSKPYNPEEKCEQLVRYSIKNSKCLWSSATKAAARTYSA